MGQGFLARDTELGRKVAIKFLTGGSPAAHEKLLVGWDVATESQTPRETSPAVRDRFLSEARTTARCNHENIVVIHELDEHEALAYTVLEYLEGETLTEMMRGCKCSPGRRPRSLAKTELVAVPWLEAG